MTSFDKIYCCKALLAGPNIVSYMYHDLVVAVPLATSQGLRPLRGLQGCHVMVTSVTITGPVHVSCAIGIKMAMFKCNSPMPL